MPHKCKKTVSTLAHNKTIKPRGRPRKYPKIITMDAFKKVSNLNLEGNLSENWRRFIQNYNIFEQATEIDKKKESVRIASFLNAVGEDAVDLYNTFEFFAEQKTYKGIVDKFEEFCNPKKRIVYEIRFLFKNTE